MFNSCSITLKNTGSAAGCEPIQKVARMLIFVPTYDSTGALNKISPNDVIDNDYITVKINHEDKTKRWYPLPLIDNVVDERGESIVETAGSGQNHHLRDGVRSMTSLLINESPKLIEKIKSFCCVDFSTFIVDIGENLIGSKKDGTNCRPIKIDKNTLSVTLIKPSYNTLQKVQVKFDFDYNEKDEDLTIIPASEMNNESLLLRKGLFDVTGIITAIATTKLTLDLSIDFGTFFNPIKPMGWVADDFSLYNVADSSAVSITSVTEISDGVYSFIFPAQTVGDEIRVTASKDGFEMASVTSTI